MKRFFAILLTVCVWAIISAPAHAEPITLFFTGVGLGLTGGGATVAGVALATGATAAGIAVGTFLPAGLVAKLLRSRK